MNDARRRLFSDENPFSTARIKPGAVQFQFSEHVGANDLVALLKQNGWRGEIVGPHGSGKSTLIQSLIPVLKTAGREVRCFTARPDDRKFTLLLEDHPPWHAATQIILEGYELLSRRDQKMLDVECRTNHAGLLITCHKPHGLPVLFETSISIELAIKLVERLLPVDCDLITPDDVRASFTRHGQNLRELLFEMYDLYEQRRPGE